MAKAAINEYIAKFSKLAEARPSGKIATDNPIVADSVTRQLPLWPSHVRGLPNALARSALFNVSNKTAKRSYFKMQAISSINGVVITYTGEELHQQDEDVFLQLVHICRERNLGEWVDFTAYSLLKSLGWTINTESYERLRAILDRLSVTNVTITFAENGESVGFAGTRVRMEDRKRAETTEMARLFRTEDRYVVRAGKLHPDLLGIASNIATASQVVAQFLFDTRKSISL